VGRDIIFLNDFGECCLCECASCGSQRMKFIWCDCVMYINVLYICLFC